jgi:hypothetical protein
MPRARKRDWQPKGLEIFDTSDLISDEALVSLITQRGAVAEVVGIDFGAISNMTRLPDYAARSIV